jgi:hypothetical protein
MTKERRKFEASYKLQIVKMVKEDGVAICNGLMKTDTPIGCKMPT